MQLLAGHGQITWVLALEEKSKEAPSQKSIITQKPETFRIEIQISEYCPWNAAKWVNLFEFLILMVFQLQARQVHFQRAAFYNRKSCWQNPKIMASFHGERFDQAVTSPSWYHAESGVLQKLMVVWTLHKAIDHVVEGPIPGNADDAVIFSDVDFVPDYF